MIYLFLIYLTIGAGLASIFSDIIVMSSEDKYIQTLIFFTAVFTLPIVLVLAYPLDYLRTKKPW